MFTDCDPDGVGAEVMGRNLAVVGGGMTSGGDDSLQVLVCAVWRVGGVGG